MKDTAVVGALMESYGVFFFEDGYLDAWQTFLQPVSGGEAYDSSADYGDTWRVRGHSSV